MSERVERDGPDQEAPADSSPPAVPESDPAEGAPSPPITPFPTEVLDKLPPQDRQRLESVFTAMMAIGPMPNPIAAKVNERHIDKALDFQSKELDLEYADRKDSRARGNFLVIALGVMAVVVILGLAFAGYGPLLAELIPLVVIFAGGFGGGYGYASRRRK